MNLWIILAIVIESMACLGVLGVLVTRNTQPAFLTGFNTMILVTGIYLWFSPRLDIRAVVVTAMVAVYLIRMNWLLLVWQKYTAVPKLSRKLSLSNKYALSPILANIAGWGYCLPFYFAIGRTESLGIIDLLAMVCYVLGTIVHFGSDYQKQRYKKRIESKNKLLTTGFWLLCRHPNYFGDFIIYVSFGLIGNCVWGWISPLLNLLQYIFDAIPKNEKWAAERYGEDWRDYVKRTKSFIPCIY
jgi:steroid 5-alpha reductase family enzyme